MSNNSIVKFKGAENWGHENEKIRILRSNLREFLIPIELYTECSRKHARVKRTHILLLY